MLMWRIYEDKDILYRWLDKGSSHASIANVCLIQIDSIIQPVNDESTLKERISLAS